MTFAPSYCVNLSPRASYRNYAHDEIKKVYLTLSQCMFLSNLIQTFQPCTTSSTTFSATPSTTSASGTSSSSTNCVLHLGCLLCSSYSLDPAVSFCHGCYYPLLPRHLKHLKSSSMRAGLRSRYTFRNRIVWVSVRLLV